MQVAITYTSSSSDSAVDELIAKIQALESSAIKIRADLRQVDAPQHIVESTLSGFRVDQIDILVNNSGCELTRSLVDITPEDINFVYDLNVRGTLLMTKAVVPHLRKPGRIINISSVGARAGFAGLSIYCSSKAAMEAFTRCWAAELGPEGHTVNVVSPGPTETRMLDSIPEAIVNMQKSLTPVDHRLGTVEDIAPVVAFLAEPGSRWISGQVISASGGWAMY